MHVFALPPPVTALLHTEQLHLVTDSVIGVVVGVAVVGLYVLALRWTGRDQDSPPRESDGSNR